MGLTERVDAVIDAALTKRIVGCVVRVQQGGQPVYVRAAGYADREAGIATAENTIFRFASLTKPVVAATALRMLDLGLLSLDDTVETYLPFFRPRAPDGSTPPITLRQLLTHTSGLSYDRVPDDVSRGSDTKPLISLEENLQRLARADLAFMPGTRWGYGMSIDVLGGVIGAINGNLSDVEAVVAKYVTGPLEMTDTKFGVADRARIAWPYGIGSPPFRMSDPQRMEREGEVMVMSPGRIFEKTAQHSGGSGMAGTAGDFVKLLEAFRGDFLKPETRAAAFSNQLGPLQRPDTNDAFGYFGAVLAGANPGWERKGMIQWGGTWGNSWTLDRATETTLVVLTNTMWEDGFAPEIGEAVFG